MHVVDKCKSKPVMNPKTTVFSTEKGRRGDTRSRVTESHSTVDQCDKEKKSEVVTSNIRDDNNSTNLVKHENGIDHEEEDDDDEEGESFAKNLNAIMLQYLESCGLVESYTTFYDECKASGMLIPDHFRTEIESGISFQDVETLLMHFDQENGDALLELWEILTRMVNEEQNSREVEKITFYIQVYIALIPFRQKMPEQTKSNTMKKLRDYFQSKSEACTMDKEMLSLFALPFVSDPETHPVFGNLFKIAWIKKLRSRIKNLARALCSPNKLITRDETDLAKMFRTCSKAVPHEIESTDGDKVCILSNVHPLEFTSGVEVVPPKGEVAGEFSPSHLFQRMNDLILENERFKAEESKYEKQCSQLLNVSILLAQSLEDAAQGKEVNMEKLRHEISLCLPVSMKSDEFKKPDPRPPSGDISCESDESHHLLDEDEEQAEEVPRTEQQSGQTNKIPK